MVHSNEMLARMRRRSCEFVSYCVLRFRSLTGQIGSRQRFGRRIGRRAAVKVIIPWQHEATAADRFPAASEALRAPAEKSVATAPGTGASHLARQGTEGSVRTKSAFAGDWSMT